MVFLTAMQLREILPPDTSSLSLQNTIAAAPFFIAAGIKSWPSKRSPLMQMKISPFFRVRESMETPLI